MITVTNYGLMFRTRGGNKSNTRAIDLTLRHLSDELPAKAQRQDMGKTVIGRKYYDPVH